jgi:methylenetetrahydrofolate reductase (NADPH)
MSNGLTRSLLADADFEVIPLQGTVEKASLIAPGTTVSVTASPSRGMAVTLDLAVRLQELGYQAVPHLSARLIEDRHHLSAIIKRLDDGGVGRVFIAGGDGPILGRYEDALSLLRDMADAGHPFLDVGITGYPEGHPSIPSDRLRQALFDKQQYATYIVTQMCFSPRSIVEWVESVRADDVVLPVKVGVPGAVEPTRLLRVAAKIGVGDSIRFLAKNRRTLLRFLRPGPYRPDRLIESLGRTGEGLGLDGIHLFTFNQVESTVRWHGRALERLG